MQLKPYHKSLILWIDIIQENSSVQPLLLNLRIFGQNFAHISYNILHVENSAPNLYPPFRSKKHQKLLDCYKIFTSRWTVIAPHIDFFGIQVTDGKVGLDAPMSLLAKISHNTHTELVVRNVNSFTIIASYNCWWPPAHMLEQHESLIR